MKKNVLKSYLQGACKICLIAVCCYLVKLFCYHRTDGFTILGVSSSRPYQPQFETRPPTVEEAEELEIALRQPYRYYGCGGQSFIFFSADQKYVIKLFKQRIFKVPFWVRYFPIPGILDRYRAKKTWQRQDKIARDFMSYKIALEEMQDETGLLFVHLNQTTHLKKKLIIIDKLNIQHAIDLDKMDFVVQKKADLVYERISLLMKKGEVEKAKQSIDAILALITGRCEKGYHDRDPNIRTNCGFLGEKAIKIDVGRLMKMEEIRKKERMLQELFRICGPFQIWLDNTYPTLGTYLKGRLEEIKNKQANQPVTF
jgi:hypothetical protein